MDRDINQVESTKSLDTNNEQRNLVASNAVSDDSFLDYEDEDELDRFEVRQSKKKIQQKRRKASVA